VRGFDCGQVRVSGYKIQQELSEEQGFAKTVTSLLTPPSVLYAGLILKLSRCLRTCHLVLSLVEWRVYLMAKLFLSI